MEKVHIKIFGMKYLNIQILKIRIETIFFVAKYTMSLPGTSVSIERIFSQLKMVWFIAKDH